MGIEPATDGRNGHGHCLLCGNLHPHSWGLSFSPTEDGGVHTFFVIGSEFQGYDNMIHGGVIATLLDSAMTHCLFHRGIEAVTGELRVRFFHPVACNIHVELRARLLFTCPPLYQLQAEMLNAGQLMARAEGKFMRRQQS